MLKKNSVGGLSCHQSIQNEDSFAIFQLPGANKVESSLDLYVKPEHLLEDFIFL